MQRKRNSWRQLAVLVPLLLILCALVLQLRSYKADLPGLSAGVVPADGTRNTANAVVPDEARPATVVINGREVPANEPPPIVRGPNKRLFYPDAVIENRDPRPGTVFAEAILRGRPGPLAGPLTVDAHTASAIEASLHHRAVWRFVESGAEFLELPLTADRDILVRVDKVVHRGGRTHTLVGKVRNEPLSDVLLVFHDGALSGAVAFHGRGDHYQYEMAGNGDVAIRHLDGASYTELCGDPGEPAADAGGEPAEDLPGDPAAEPPAGAMVMDTVIGYGAQARAAQGGTAAMEAKVLQGIDRLNLAIDNSLVADSFVSLVATVEDPDYVFPGAVSGSMSSSDELGDLNDASVGNPELNTISQLRIDLGADHNGFVIKQADGSAGVAYRPGRSMLVARTYITSTRITFAHEFGHNVGCNHSWGDSSSDSSKTIYRYGWRLDPPSSTRVRTIMAYDWNWGSGHRIPYFANPLVEFNNARTGQVDGYNATGDSESDSRYVSGGLTGSAGSGFDGGNSALGARNADYFEERDQFLGDNATRTTLAVVDPGSGVVWAPGQTETIFWYGGDHTDSAQLDLYKGGVFQNTIASGFDAHLRYHDWAIPPGQAEGTDYTIRLTLNGSTVDDSPLFTIANPNSAPTDIALSPDSVAENEPAGTTVGTFSTTDAEGGPFTYALVSGAGSADNGSFTISGSSLETAAVFDYETKSSYAIRVRSTDPGSLSTEKQFTVTVTNVLEPPTAPSGLAATGGGGSISLTWQDNSSNESGFQVERSATGGGVGFSLIHTTAADATGYVDSGLPDDTTYHYRIVATNAEGSSGPSNEADATTLTTLAAWRQLYGLASDGSEDLTDTDKDGLTALMEFALHLNPTVENATGHPVTSLADHAGSPHLTITFRRRTGGVLVSNTWQVDGITYRVEVTTDMETGSWQSDVLNVEWDPLTTDNGDGTETATCRLKTPVSLAGDDYFIRLVVFETP